MYVVHVRRTCPLVRCAARISSDDFRVDARGLRVCVALDSPRQFLILDSQTLRRDHILGVASPITGHMQSQLVPT